MDPRHSPGGLSGTVPVTVSIYGVVSATFSANVVAQSPSLFVYRAGSTLYPAATHADGRLIGDPAVQPGSSKAKAGEEIVLYVNGLTSSPGGTLISVPVPYSDPVTVIMGTEHAAVSFAGLVAAGQFQVNVEVPPDLPTGNYPIAIAAGGITSPGTIILAVE